MHMIYKDLFPPALRTAPAAEQLAYLLKRRETILNLIGALEKFQAARSGSFVTTRGPVLQSSPEAVSEAA
jgi:hypothetical protein